MAKQTTVVRTHNIEDGAITDTEVSATAAIQESKLALNHSTNDLYDYALRTNEDRTIDSSTTITFPYLVLIDQITGTKYKLTINNGELTLQEIV